MNRLIKGILYITAGCIGIGFAALILGLVLGGGSQVWDTGFQRVKDKVRDAVVVAEKNAHNHVIQQRTEDAVVDHSMDEEYDMQYEAAVYGDGADDFSGDMGIFAADASSIQKLVIDIRHGSLSIEEIEEADDNRVIVSVDGPANGVKASCSSGTLTIQDERTGNKARKDACVYLEIPKGMQLESASIRVDAGVVDTEASFYAKDLSLDAGAGEIDLSDVTADTFAASVGAGNLDITDSSFQAVKLDCGVGNMDIDADITGNAKIKCGMGTVSLELAKGATSVNYELECGAGSIEIGDNLYTGLAKKSQLNNGAQSTFTVSCGMGQIYID